MTKTHKNVSDEVMAAAAAATDPKALSDAAETEKPAANGSAKQGRSQSEESATEYRLRQLEAQVKNLNELVNHWQNIYQWPVPWKDGIRFNAGGSGAAEPATKAEEAETN